MYYAVMYKYTCTVQVMDFPQITAVVHVPVHQSLVPMTSRAHPQLRRRERRKGRGSTAAQRTMRGSQTLNLHSQNCHLLVDSLHSLNTILTSSMKKIILHTCTWNGHVPAIPLPNMAGCSIRTSPTYFPYARARMSNNYCGM